MACLPISTGAAELAVVIDDVGYNKARGMRAIELPGPVTIAVLPFAPNTPELVKYASLLGKDIIVHQPMEPEPSPRVRNEQGTLTLDMARPRFAKAVNDALDAVPGRIGVSNHTGSLLTAHRAPMQQFMTLLNRRGLFFLDSRTTAATVALDVAREYGVPAVKRDVFLDHINTRTAIHQSFERAIRIARKQGHAVLIGHPYQLSLSYLEDRLSELPADIVLVNAATLAQPQAKTVLNNPTVLAQPPRLTTPHILPGQ